MSPKPENDKAQVAKNTTKTKIPRRKYPKLSSNELVKLRTDITESALKIRTMKENGATKEEILPIVHDLLEKKFLDPENMDCVAPKGFKLRWWVQDKEGKRVRYQVPVSNSTSLSADEVLSFVTDYTRNPRRLGESVGGVARIEVGAVNEATGQKEYRTLLASDRVRLPLVFPGPTFPDCLVVDLRVTFIEKPMHHTTPSVYKDIKTYAKLPALIDCGVNLVDKDLYARHDDVVQKSVACGVVQMVSLSTTLDGSQKNVQIAKKHRNTVFCVVGVHPGQVLEEGECTKEKIEQFRALCVENKGSVVGLGEIGMDFSSHGVKDVDEKQTVSVDEQKKRQAQWFEEQLKLANELNLPVVIHERDCHTEVLQIMNKYKSELEKIKCVINCFNGTKAALDAYVAFQHLYIGVTGLISNADRGVELRDVIGQCPIDRVVIGSDAPYLLPFNMGRPFPKKGVNEPAYLAHVLVSYAEMCNKTLAEVANTLTQNTVLLYNLPTVVYGGEVCVGENAFNINRYGKKKVDDSNSAASVQSVEEARTHVNGVAIADCFEFMGNLYKADEMTKNVLNKQKVKLDEEKFKALLKDFELELVGEMPKAKKAKKAAPTKAKKNAKSGKKKKRGQK